MPLLPASDSPETEGHTLGTRQLTVNVNRVRRQVA